MLEIKYHSHSVFEFTDGKYHLIIDPFLSGNPTATADYNKIIAEYIILTHAHGDHFGDTKAIAENNLATVIAVNELAQYCGTLGLKHHAMHIGGSYNFPFGKLKFTPAWHGSSSPTGKYMGSPAGVVLKFGGKTIYHAGDTGIFLDMKLIGELDKIDICFLPIGGNFTMDIDDAVKAVEFINPELVIPIHYNTFPVIEANPNEFVDKVKALGKKAQAMQYGEVIKFD